MAVFFLFTVGCKQTEKVDRGAELYEMHCARCHIAPDIDDLPKEYWTNYILPEMAARMGIKSEGFKPYEGMVFEEMEIVHNSGIYPYMPILNEKDWGILKDYILDLAPDSLRTVSHEGDLKKQIQFEANTFPIDDVPGSFFTFLKYQEEGNKFWTGDISGNLLEYSFSDGKTRKLHSVENAVVDYIEKDTVSYITDIGILDPSELSTGRIFAAYNNETKKLPDTLHRPVNNLVLDLNNDGVDEMVISEFGHLTGELSMLVRNNEGTYEKRTLLSQPGTIRTVAKDMDADGDLDLIAITSQGDESITILYQQDNLVFKTDKAIRFSPIYGSSWFELIDFDQDGDFDFAIISTFPDYENKPEYSLVYLENKDSSLYQFQTYSFEEANLSRWFLLDKGDVDLDGDMDIILSAFTYVFTPVPRSLSVSWGENNADIMILENKLFNEDHIE